MLFDDFTFTFDGVDYVITANKLLKTMAALEKAGIDRYNLLRMRAGGGLPTATASMGLHMIIKAAGGADVTEADIYAKCNANIQVALNITDALLTLFEPPEEVAKASKEQDKAAPTD